MSDSEEYPDYLPIKPGDRVFIDYESPRDTELFGGLGTVVTVNNAWTAVIRRDKSGIARLYPRWLLKAATE